MTKTNLLMGADPELFVRDTITGKLVSAYGMIPGTKEKPYPVKRGAVQVDGMAVEFNIDPAATEDEWVLNLITVMAQLQRMLPLHHELAIMSTAEFGEEYIKSQPLEAQELGCDPDWNAWTGTWNPTPDQDSPFRTAAGHIHIGWCDGKDDGDIYHVRSCEKIVKLLDSVLGYESLYLDTDTRRRDLYGAAGACRVKPYGVEYRVLSNYWLSNEATMRYVYRRVMECWDFLGRTRRHRSANVTPHMINRGRYSVGHHCSPRPFRASFEGMRKSLRGGLTNVG